MERMNALISFSENQCTFQKKNGSFCKMKKKNETEFCKKHIHHPKKSIMKKYDGTTVIEYRNNQNQLHREDGPAYIERNKNITIHKWYKFGVSRNVYHTPNKIEKIKNHKIGQFTIPLYVTKYFGIDSNTNKLIIECYNSSGLLHSVDFSIPSVESICDSFPSKMWHINGANKSIGYLKPCSISHGCYTNVKTREKIVTEQIVFSTFTDLFIIYNETENKIEYKWKKNGHLHRDEDKPSMIRIHNDPLNPKYDELYYKNGKQHRLCGPANIQRLQNKSTWYFYSHQVDDQYLTPSIKSIMALHDSNSVFICKCCFDMFSTNALPLECGHWMHCFCYQIKKFTHCLECNSEISDLHTNFLKSYCHLFVDNS